MAEQHKTTIPSHELAADIDSYRMGLWWMMMHRGQGHLAHAVLRSGMVAMQRLWMVVGWDQPDSDEFAAIQDACRHFYDTMLECVALVGDKGEMAKYRAKIEQLGQRLYDCARLKQEVAGPVYRGMGKAIVGHRLSRGLKAYTKHTLKGMPPVGPEKPLQGELFPPEGE